MCNVDQPIICHILATEFANVKIIYTLQKYPTITSIYLQNHLNSTSFSYSEWRIKMSNDKSSHIKFLLNRGVVTPITLYNQIAPNSH